jgi:hypothetical protein
VNFKGPDSVQLCQTGGNNVTGLVLEALYPKQLLLLFEVIFSV